MKHNLLRSFFSFLLVLLTTTVLFSQPTLYDINTIQKIELTFSQPNWDQQLDTSKAGADGYIMADQVLINGVAFDSVGVKYKGNSSYSAAYVKNPLHISLNEYKSQSYQGYKDLKLSNEYSDPSLIREVLAYNILKNYMDCPKSNFAQVYINGNYIGVYSNDENIASSFLNEHFYSSNNTFIKCNPIINPGPTTKCNLKYINTDSTSYYNFYEVKSASGWADLIQLCDAVTNYSSSISTILDMDRFIWMLAFNNSVINLDSYTGAFCQNYYLYKDNNYRFNPIVWDLNMAFGSFPFVGSGNTSLGTLTIANMQQLSPTIHATDPYWPVINAVMNNPTLKRKYIAHLKTITEEMLVSNTYQTNATQYQTLIDTAVASDANNFYTYSQFQNGMTANVSSGSYQIPGISTLVAGRISYLQSTPEFQNIAPVISGVSYVPSTPVLGDTVFITATITNNVSQYVGIRTAASEIFTYVTMYDDGLHQDGAAGDQVFGAAIVAQGPALQYYIYAENSAAGIFSPARAEHEFYSITVTVPLVTYKEITINEFMAKNDTTVTDANGEYEDWFEIYNTTNNTLNLGNTYASVSFSNPTMWRFPFGTTIAPQSVLSVWCDQDTTQAGIHANFKLSASGSQLLLANANSAVIDSITFGPQSADISMFRCPDGFGPWGYTMFPTYNQRNCAVGIAEHDAETRIKLYPNPASSIVNIESQVPIQSLELYSTFGTKVYSTKTSSATSISLVLPDLAPGMYVVQVNGKLLSKKLLIQH